VVKAWRQEQEGNVSYEWAAFIDGGVLRRTFRRKREGVTGDRRKLRNEEHYDMY
jgi:hypothetical protein